MPTLQPVGHVERPGSDSRLACLDQAISFSIAEPLNLRFNDLAFFSANMPHVSQQKHRLLGLNAFSVLSTVKHLKI